MFKSLALIAAILCTAHIPALVSGAVPFGVYVIRNSANCTQVLDENRETGHAIGWRLNGGNNQKWTVAPVNVSEPQFVTIRNVETLRYVNGTGGMAPEPYTFNVYSLNKNGDTTIGWRSRTTGNEFALELTGANDGAIVEESYVGYNAAQLWWFLAVDK
ncbi:hypothetical protein BGX34_004070 [Mortierella sp. NVP85]|nr:hypothetical protein BGX34_004070 [Mortierella sp. NVP85]